MILVSAEDFYTLRVTYIVHVDFARVLRSFQPTALIESSPIMLKVEKVPHELVQTA